MRTAPALVTLLTCLLAVLPTVAQSQSTGAAPPDRPNVVVFLTDDQGYADLSSYGHPTIRTPNLDEMAHEGMRLTSFYATAVCTPSRAQFLTGRYPFRSGLINAIGPNASIGLPAEEVTLAEALKEQGYRTAMLGKWHLGDFASDPEYNPIAHGFDYFFGIPYSHDYRDPFVRGAPPVPLYRNHDLLEEAVGDTTLTQRLTREALRFIEAAGGNPFFIYLAYAMPHLPVVVSEDFRGRSRAGRYGDSIEEIDESVGQILDLLKARGIDENTLVVFFSDNGPWSNAQARSFQEGQSLWDTGSAGLLRGTKATTWEGGVRVPGIIRWPAAIPPGQVSAEIVSAMDLFPTIVNAAGGTLPENRSLDGYDLMPLLSGGGSSPRREVFYIVGRNVEAVRQDQWKLRSIPGGDSAPASTELYHLDWDPGERHDVAADHPEIVERLLSRLEAFRREAAAALPPEPTL